MCTMLVQVFLLATDFETGRQIHLPREIKPN